MEPGTVEAFLKSIDCYVIGSKTYETAVRFEKRGLGWAYGDKPVFVLASQKLRPLRSTIEFYSGELSDLIDGLRGRFGNIWCVGGGVVCGECLRLELADEIRYSILPILIGEGISFFENLGRDVSLHLLEMKGYKRGMIALRYEVQK